MTTQSLKKITLETFRNACPVVGNVDLLAILWVASKTTMVNQLALILAI